MFRSCLHSYIFKIYTVVVHALFHGNQKIRRVVAFFYAMEIIGMAVGLALALPGVTYDNLCLVLSVPHSLIIYGYVGDNPFDRLELDTDQLYI